MRIGRVQVVRSMKPDEVDYRVPRMVLRRRLQKAAPSPARGRGESGRDSGSEGGT